MSPTSFHIESTPNGWLIKDLQGEDVGRIVSHIRTGKIFVALLLSGCVMALGISAADSEWSQDRDLRNWVTTAAIGGALIFLLIAWPHRRFDILDGASGAVLTLGTRFRLFPQRIFFLSDRDGAQVAAVRQIDAAGERWSISDPHSDLFWVSDPVSLWLPAYRVEEVSMGRTVAMLQPHPRWVGVFELAVDLPGVDPRILWAWAALLVR